MKFCSIVLLSLAFSAAAPAQTGSAVHVRITNLKVGGGEVRCALFTEATGFPRQPDRAAMRVVGRITGRTADCHFANVASGRIAITAFHDENNNGRMDLRFGLIPREGIGWSRNPSVSMRAPRFDEAAFDYDGGRNVIDIVLNQR